MGYGGDTIDDEYASRPIVNSGESQYGGSGLGIHGAIANGPVYASQSKDSVTLNGGSEDSFNSDKDASLRL